MHARCCSCCWRTKTGAPATSSSSLSSSSTSTSLSSSVHRSFSFSFPLNEVSGCITEHFASDRFENWKKKRVPKSKQKQKEVRVLETQSTNHILTLYKRTKSPCEDSLEKLISVPSADCLVRHLPPNSPSYILVLSKKVITTLPGNTFWP